MAVGFSFRVDIRPYSGYIDPSLPTAAWISQAGAVGNASGGNINLDFLFQRDDDARISDLFNLEQISVDTTGTSSDGVIQTISMDQLAANREGSPQKWGIQLTARSGGASVIDLQDINALPLWLGAPNSAEGDSGIRLFLPNVDLRLYAVTLQGYMWGPRSVLAPGGPRRPVGGLFGSG